MKQVFFLLLLAAIKPVSLQAQQYDCNFKGPIITINFGDDSNPKNLFLSSLKDNYAGTTKICPDDGEFSFVSYTNDCFFGNWISFYKDHTPGSINGHMMLVNASYKPATFFTLGLAGLEPNKMYQLSVWFVNVCRSGEHCDPTPPEIRIATFADGKILSKFYTGTIPPTGTDTWRRTEGYFKTPAAFSAITIAMDDETSGGCGNDFAMDDIEIRECKMIEPVQKPAPAPPVVINKPIAKTNVPKPTVKTIQKETPAPANLPGRETSVVKKEPVQKQSNEKSAVIKPIAPAVLIPDVIKERENPVIEKIETASSDILIELYDNGEIDGDSVTIFHNNELIVSHAGLSTKPVTVKIKVDKENPHHELVMVADNLGSIPPNTSLMVITTKYRRYEVFISSSEQKNAKVVIDLKKE